jgi:hypothetical protein
MKSKAQDIEISNIKTKKGRVVESWYAFVRQDQVGGSGQESRRTRLWLHSQDQIKSTAPFFLYSEGLLCLKVMGKYERKGL